MLEGDVVMDSNQISTPGNEIGNRSGRTWLEQQQQQSRHLIGPISSEILEGFGGKLVLKVLRNFFC